MDRSATNFSFLPPIKTEYPTIASHYQLSTQHCGFTYKHAADNAASIQRNSSLNAVYTKYAGFPGWVTLTRKDS